MDSTELFHLDLIEQHFYGPQPELDVSQGGRLRVVINGVVVQDGADDDTGVARSAVALSRTLMRDHTPEDPVVEKLIMHDCGLPSYILSSCPVGANWWVRHEGDSVRIDGVARFPTTNERDAEPFPSASVVMPAALYVSEIANLGRAVLDFADASPKAFPSDFERQDWEKWRSELRQNLSEARSHR